jgi:HTH-type transcriptional regulator, transcriptional repressor of NAD biosynthesis genes
LHDLLIWPLHVGHVQLLDSAAAASERAIVVVDDGSEDVPARVRVGWVTQLFPSAQVVTAPDLCGHDTSECTPECSQRYASWLLSNHGPVDIVFSGESYGERLSSSLGCAPVRVKRSAAGREIRADVVGHWNLLAKPARAWYCRRVVTVGAESTGTTTLAHDLADLLGTTCVPEYGRGFTAQHGLDHEWTSS